MNAVEMLEIGIAALLFADSDEVDGSRLLVDAQNLGDVARAVRDLVFELAGGEVVEVEIAPVVAFAEPQNFIGSGEIMPVDLSVAALEKFRCGLTHEFANIACRCVSNA